MTGLFALACSIVGLPRVPERRPDYTVTLQGQSFGLSDESDQDAPLIVWTGAVPQCPTCSQQLLEYGQEDTKAAPVRFISAWVSPFMDCLSCGASLPLKDVR